MEDFGRDGVIMQSEKGQKSVEELIDSRVQTFVSRTQSASISIPMESYERETNLVGHTAEMGGLLYSTRKPQNLFQRNQSLPVSLAGETTVRRFRSFSGTEQNGWPDNTNAERNEHLLKKASGLSDTKLHNDLPRDDTGWARRIFSSLHPYVFGVLNPHTKLVQRWNKFVVLACLGTMLFDPMFFFLLSVRRDHKCIAINRTWTMVFVVVRSLFDFIFLLNMLLQFRLAYVAPESRIIGAGELVDQPKKVARRYFCGYFFLDLPTALPIPQIVMLLVKPAYSWSFGANATKNVVLVAILIQDYMRLLKCPPLIFGQSPVTLVFVSAWANIGVNILALMLSGHIVGSCWYLFGLQRVEQCFQKACSDSKITSCEWLIDCALRNNLRYQNESTWTKWSSNELASSCFSPDGFTYGIFKQAVNLTTEEYDGFFRYGYSLFWGFQQLSTLAGNQTPGYFWGEVIFTMFIVGVGLLLLTLLIGSIQNFFQALGQRNLEMSVRCRDVEQWMKYHHLPQELKMQVREAKHYNWVATRGIKEEGHIEDLPEDLQRNIRSHIFKFVKKVRIFSLIDKPILDAICERLRQKIYINRSLILYPGGLVDKMVFIVCGKMESIGEEGNLSFLSKGDVCGEELLSWCLEHSSVDEDVGRSILGQRLISNRMVRCITNVEAFSLQAADLEEVISTFSGFLRNPRVQRAIRYESPYWRTAAAIRIQVAWRYRKKRQTRTHTASSSKPALSSRTMQKRRKRGGL